MGDVTLENHELHFEYSGKYKDYNLNTLGVYLGGKPDTPGWRELFNQQQVRSPNIDWTPIPYMGKIFPKWALLDLYKLMESEPGIEEQILLSGSTLQDIPSLEQTLSTD